MKIRKMTASFGVLQNETMELGDGLNIVNAPNESGKSTWCAFIKSMLYGIDSSAREKGGMKPDKIKYAPWNGAPMAGTMDIEFEGQELTLARSGKESAPMRDFMATLSGTASPVKISSTAVGETLIGVPRDVFERSAFIGQGNVAVGASPELEKRIASIVQTGDENSSCTEAVDKLRAAMRKRRHNKSGRLPEIETEIAAVRENLFEIDREQRRGEELRIAKAKALERRDALTEQVAESRKQLRRDSLDKLTNSRNTVRELENDLSEKREEARDAETRLQLHPFGMDEPEVCRGRIQEDATKIKELEKSLESGKKSAIITAVLVLDIIIAVLLGVFEIGKYIPSVVLGLGAIGLIYLLMSLSKARRSATAEKHEILFQYDCESIEKVYELLTLHDKLYNAMIKAEKNEEEAQSALDRARQEQTKLDEELLKDLDFTAGDNEASEFTGRLEEAENNLRRLREESAAWEGRQSALGSRQELIGKLSALTTEHERLSLEYDALLLAADTLKEAGEEIQSRLTPRLSQRTSEIFARLTEGKYDAIALDRDLKALAKASGDPISRETAFLSVGAVDQLYLAVRLAICELALPEDKTCPLILDDALVNFDDERCRQALEFLLEIARERQVIAFTCHTREANFLRNCPDVTIVNA